MVEYESIKRALGETIQDYFTRFNNIYNSIPVVIQPPPRITLIKFLDGFDVDMSYHLRERNPATLEEMKINAVSVEAKLLPKRERLKAERRVTIKEELASSLSDAKLDTLVKTMERMMKMINLTDMDPLRETQGGP